LEKRRKSKQLFAEISQIKTALCRNIANQNSFLLKLRKSKQLFAETSQIKTAFC
jgi:hypothetical protein